MIKILNGLNWENTIAGEAENLNLLMRMQCGAQQIEESPFPRKAEEHTHLECL